MLPMPMFLHGNINNAEVPADNEKVQEGNIPARRPRVPRLFRDPLDPLHIPDDHLLRYYRFPRHEIIEIMNMVRPSLERTTRRSHALPVIIQVLVSLRFLASGSFQSVLADTGHISQPSCSRIIGCFCAKVVELANQSILLALNSQQYVLNVKEGDSEYPSERRLLTPFRNPMTNAEERYNASHIRTRNTIERTIGLWKSRFRCIDSSGGSLQYTVEKIRNIVIATAVLHNRCVERRIPLNQDLSPGGIGQDLQEALIDYPTLEGIRVRREVVERYFTN